MKVEWTGLDVCKSCFELRHPQDFLRVHPEKIVPDMIGTQDGTSKSVFTGMVGIAVAGIAIAGDGLAAPTSTVPSGTFTIEL